METMQRGVKERGGVGGYMCEGVLRSLAVHTESILQCELNLDFNCVFGQEGRSKKNETVKL